MKKRIFALLLSTAMLATMLAGCGGSGSSSGGSAAAPAGSAPAAPSGKTQILTIGTADSTGTMYPVGAAVASVINDNVPGFKVNVETSKGSPANCVNIQSGEVQLATIAGDTAAQAVKGEGKFEGQACSDLRAICAVYTSLSNWIALKSSGLTMVNELGGKNVAIGPEASTTEIAGLAGLAAAGVEPAEKVNLGLGDGANEVGDGVRDASHGFAGIPIGGQLSVAQTKDCVFLGYTDAELDKVVEANPSYYKTVIPAGTYPGQDADVPTFGVKCLIVANASLDDDTAYAFAEALATHVSDLVAGHASMKSMEDPSFICNDLPIELHPGAAKYYQEAGMLK
ncbi:TAXI family TRAP transporter solute-binding subunit [Dysosmobacter sp.]|uniref:TAXI family TRAP transporter solute-binding subunit n=1 Tax=Dysosmobacter sp. TaxID=2591382 RepID=UPI002A87FF6A|nr:TAXI family TRAP transporter solute-binding subunit [Dysosmobacter sp.]MDY3280819.1 TAXI family TRAP transporter solute-binding subunit [Dysosmobacter sp.]